MGVPLFLLNLHPLSVRSAEFSPDIHSVLAVNYNIVSVVFIPEGAMELCFAKKREFDPVFCRPGVANCVFSNRELFP